MRYFADKIVYDKYEPENTNVVWVQPTEEGAQIKAYIDGEWQLIGYDHDAYRKPASGIPESDLEESVRNAIDNAQHLDGKIDAEIERSERVDANLNERLGIVEQLADISISGGDATIATASDFNNPTAEQKAYIPTVGAILDGADTTPTSGSGKLVTSGGVYNVINSLKSAGYVFAGVATTSTSPGTPTEKVFYIGGAGTYANFGTSVTVPVGSVCVFKYNGSWVKEQIVVMDNTFINKVEYSTEQTRNLADAAIRNDNYYLNSSGMYDYEAGNMCIIFPCQASTTYTISKTITTRFRVAYFSSYPENRAVGGGIISNNSAASITITTNASAAYLVAYIYNSTGETKTKDEVLASLQIELGSTATEYVAPYTAKDVVARNDISELEVVLGSTTKGLTDNDIITGGFRTYDTGVIGSNSAYFYSKPIKLYTGDKVIISTTTIPTVVAAISIVDENNNFLYLVYQGEGQDASYTFEVYEDMYVGLSAPLSRIAAFSIQREGGLQRLSDNIEQTGDLSRIVFGGNTGLRETEINKGYYRSTAGALEQMNAYFYSKPILVHLGDIITTSSTIAPSSSVSVISEVDKDNVYISTLKAGNGTSQTINYTVPKDCYISISALQTQLGLFGIELNGIDERIEMIDGSISLGADNLPILTDNPLTQIRREQGYGAIIRKWGIIGDSLSSGEMQCYNSDSSSATDYKFIDMYQYSWGQVFARLIGATAYNYSNGGQTTWGWLKSQGVVHDDTYIGGVGGGDWDLAQQAGEEKDAYIIALGVNDRKKIEDEDYVLGSTSQITQYDGTTSDIDDTTTYPKSFVRYYAGIIQRLLSIQPKAKIFCMTPLGENYSAISQTIRDIVTYFGGNVYLVDMVTYIPEGYKVSGFNLNGHLSPMGYAYIGYLVNTYIDWIIRKNGAAFIDTALIGTNYRPSF